VFLPVSTAIAAPESAPANDAATRFGAREDIQQVSLSPDGQSIAYLAPYKDRGTALFVVSVAEGIPRAIAPSSGDPERLRRCSWSSDTRLDHHEYSGFTRLFAIDSDGKNLKMLSAKTNERSLGIQLGGGGVLDWNGGAPGTILMARSYVPETTTGSLVAETREGFGVDRIDTSSLRRLNVEPPNGDAVEYLSDGYGTVRIMGKRPKLNTGFISDAVLYSYRKPGDRAWLPLGTLKTTGGVLTGFNP
jgi:hypothetical protein